MQIVIDLRFPVVAYGKDSLPERDLSKKTDSPEQNRDGFDQKFLHR